MGCTCAHTGVSILHGIEGYSSIYEVAVFWLILISSMESLFRRQWLISNASLPALFSLTPCGGAKRRSLCSANTETVDLLVFCHTYIASRPVFFSTV
jgi:hypothetical protein